MPTDAEVLIVSYGSEDVLKLRLEELKASEVDVDPELIELVERYLEGWRP